MTLPQTCNACGAISKGVDFNRAGNCVSCIEEILSQAKGLGPEAALNLAEEYAETFFEETGETLSQSTVNDIVQSIQ